MIITKKKDIKDILKFLKDKKTVFLVGCAQCATVCNTGGEEELLEMEKALIKEGKIISHKEVLDVPCQLVKVKQCFQKNKSCVESSDAVLVMACGNGVQSVVDVMKKKKVYPALDTLFLGKVERKGYFYQNCSLCGECIIDETAGICPLTICTKGLLNGPCGGSKGGKCEADRERDCGWLLIYRRLSELGEVDNMKTVKPPKDNSKSVKPQKITPQQKKDI